MQEIKYRKSMHPVQCNVPGCRNPVYQTITRRTDPTGSVRLCETCVREIYAATFPEEADQLTEALAEAQRLKEENTALEAENTTLKARIAELEAAAAATASPAAEISAEASSVKISAERVEIEGLADVPSSDEETSKAKKTRKSGAGA